MRRAGLVLLGLLSVADVVSAFLTDGQFPPLWIAVLGGILGLASLAVLVPAWRGNRTALGVLIGLRVVSAASALPAFGVTGVPGPVVALAGAIVLLTVVGCLLAMRRSPVSPRRARSVPGCD